MENPEIFTRVLLNEKIKLEPEFIKRGFRYELERRLASKFEGVCSKHGYIRHNSIKIYKNKPGLVELISLNGFIQYDIYFYADVCNPLIGSLLKCQITNKNKFGLFAEAGYMHENKLYKTVEIIVPNDTISIKSDIDLIDKYNIGDIIQIEVIGKKYELKELKISILGKISTGDIKKTKVNKHESPNPKPILDDEIDDDPNDPEAISDIISDVGEEVIEDLEGEEEDSIRIGGDDGFDDEEDLDDDEDIEDEDEGDVDEDFEEEEDNGLNFDE